MVFDNVYPSAGVADSLESKCGCEVAVIPFMDCMPNTSYLVSRDGAHVFVSVDFGGYCQVKEVSITPAGMRSAKSKPSFKRRNRNGSQTSTTLPAAVYGAFVLSELPRYKLRHIDGDPNNCHVDNLEVGDDSVVRRNLDSVSHLYEEKFENICKGIMAFRRISIEDAQDYASDAFMRMCQSRKLIDVSNATGLWMFLAKEKVINYKTRNRIMYDTYNAFQNVALGEESDEDAVYESVMALLPSACRKAVSLILSGYNQRETSKMMGCSQSWVNALLKKAKSILEGYDQQS